MSIGHLFIHTCDIYESSVSSGTTGQIKASWTLSQSGVKCSIQPRGERLPLEIQGQMRRGSHQGFFDIGSAPNRGDRILWNGIYLDVTGVHNYRNNHLQIDLDEVHQRDSVSGSGAS